MTTRLPFDLPVLVLGDMIAAACDDLGIKFTSRDIRRVAPRVIELLALAGYRIEPAPAAQWDDGDR